MAQKHNSSGPPRPTITLPPRPSMDTLFTGGFSPGPMTLLSGFYSSDNYPDSSNSIGGSFSQLLAGAMASPLARPSLFHENSINNTSGTAGLSKGEEGNSNLGFKQSRPMSLMVARSPLFTVPPGLSPSGLLNSPGFFSPQSPFGMSHQQALAQVTAQAALANQSHMHMQSHYQQPYTAPPTELMPSHPSSSAAEGSQQHQHVPPSTSHHQSFTIEPSESSQSDKKYQPPAGVDKPNDDGYNWRKYGQKPIKGSEYPRSYYKCTHLKCPVKKKVERSSDGQITEIIYKGQHNHEMPQSNKRARDNNDQSGTVNSQAKSEVTSMLPSGNTSKLNEMVPMQNKRQESNQADPVEVPGSSDSEEGGDPATRENGVGDEPDPKRRQTESVASEPVLTQKTVTESKIIVQTRSEVDLLDDGYRWRKYGQKVVKGNPHPRSYYKCTTAGCNVRKHVERAAADPKAVITTYEGKHNHDVPAARNSSHSTSTSNMQQPKPQNVVAEKPSLVKGMDFGNNDQRPVLLRLKEEEIAV